MKNMQIRMTGRTLAAAALVSAATMASPAPAAAQELVLGAGAADFSFSGAKDGGFLALEYRAAPFRSGPRSGLGLAASINVDRRGDAFVGFGLSFLYELNQSWFIEASVMPGFFSPNLSVNDLGNSFEIRSLASVGYRLDENNALSLALTHASNAGTGRINPGVNALLLRWHRRL